MEFEEDLIKNIQQKKIIAQGETIGVACSGGSDSMALLNFLWNAKDALGCKIVAITVDHMLRGENSKNDVLFVKDWCKKQGVECLCFTVDAGKLSSEKNIGVEEGAREARYNIFEKLLNKKTVDKIALAHHLSDQAETVLMHILRGAGIGGASGMVENRCDRYIRPFLNLSKKDLVDYCSRHYIDYVVDETNQDTKYNRNFLRNIIIPALKERWENVENCLANFAKSCQEDNDYILGNISCSGVIFENNLVKIPINYFNYPASVINRIIFSSLEKIGITRDFERKHIELIKELVNLENGKKINLPNGLIAQKEYDYLTIFKLDKEVIVDVYPFKRGILKFGKSFELNVKGIKKFELQEGTLFLDSKKIPKNAVWRTRKEGDIFTKFGGGTKPLKEFFIDKKISSRLRDLIPILAVDKEVLCVSGYEISDKVKVTTETKSVVAITCKQING